MMQPTECSRCSRELPPSSTVCVYCGQPQNDDPLELEFETFDDSFSDTPLADGPVAPAPAFLEEPTAPVVAAASTALPASVEMPAPAVKPRMSPRELATLVVGVVGGSFLVFGLLMARGAASPVSNVKVTAASPTSQSTPQGERGAAGPSWIANPAWVGRARQSVAFELAARNEVQVWMRKVRPVLIVRCMARGTEAFVFTDSAARMEPQDEDHTVRVQFDNEAVVTERWPDSQEHDALFARDGAAFAHRLMQARTLEFGYTPHNAGPVVAQFDVAGLASLLTPAARQCGWKGK